MLDTKGYDREDGEPHGAYMVRVHRAARRDKMKDVKGYILNVVASGMPFDESLLLALEALTEIVDDILDEGFV